MTGAPKRKPAKRNTAGTKEGTATPSRERRAADEAAEHAKARERARQRSGSDD